MLKYYDESELQNAVKDGLVQLINIDQTPRSWIVTIVLDGHLGYLGSSGQIQRFETYGEASNLMDALEHRPERVMISVGQVIPDPVPKN